MNEILYLNAGFLTKCLEFLAALTGLLFFSKFRGSNIKYFIYFLCYVFVLELIGGYTVYAHKYEALAEFKSYIQGNWLRRNNWFYCLFWTVGSAVFYSFYFAKHIVNPLINKAIKILSIAFILYSLIAILYNWDAFFVTGIKSVNIFSTIVITVSICFYLIEVLKNDEILIFHKNMNVYISVAVLLWTVITAPIAFFVQYFNVNDWSFVYLKTNIFFFSNVLLYFTFIIGFIISKPNNKV